MLVSDPRCLDFLDHYSNVLYTLHSRERLAFIAQLASTVDRYRPETCCILGNYYSLSSRHEDAVKHFRQALSLDRTFASAWTLLGHEYFKLQNTHAAIESYRRAVDLNNKDYRAFVGLGQVYGVLEKLNFSLYYYRRAVALRPVDVDMWQMIATCLKDMSRTSPAIGALKKAIACTSVHIENSPKDGFDTKSRRTKLLFQLANMYEESQNRPEAIMCLENCLSESDAVGNNDDANKKNGSEVVSIIARARLLLAQWQAVGVDYPEA